MATEISPRIVQAVASVPASILEKSGSVFYTGRSAFSSQSSVYVLGLNPGGCPMRQRNETVAADIEQFWSQPAVWSAYSDESWEGKAPGTAGMQPRMLHLFARLGLDPRQVPASNVVFVRSRSEADLARQKQLLLDACWPVHEAVIEVLQVKAVMCLGNTASQWVRARLGAHEHVDTFVEANARGWQSKAHRASNGMAVLTLTHPGRVDWRNPAADPSTMIRKWI